MRKTILQRLSLICLAALACATAVSAQTVESIPYRVILSPANEVPPVSLAATGGAFVFLHVVRDAQGEVISGSVDFQVRYNFPSPQTITAMHIHAGAAGANGPVVIDSGTAQIPDATTGVIPTLQAQVSTSTTAALNAVKGILADPSQYYLNVHTTANPAGVFRGQLIRAQRAVRTVIMSGANEVPPTTVTATGRATAVIYRSVNSDGVTTSANIIFDIAYLGFPADTVFTGLHLHAGAAGANGPVTIDSGMTNPTPAAANGNGFLRYALEVDMARNGAVATIENVFNNPSAIYMNLHTTANPGGAIRGQLMRTDAVSFPVMMSPSEEVPPITTLDVSAPGRVTVFTSRDPNGTAMAGTIVFDINPRFANAPDTTFTAMHIHDGAAGANGPVSLDSRFNSVPVYFTGGVGNLYRVNSLPATAMASLNSVVTNPELHYANLHSQANPAGVVRAQLARPNTDKPVIGDIIAGASEPTLTTVAPGGIAAIYGINFSKSSTNIDGINTDRVPTSFNGTSVTIAGVRAPIILLERDQVNVQVPFEVQPGQQPVVVTNVNGASEPKMLTVAASAPAVLFDATGGIAYRVSTQGLIRPTSPAVAGEMLLILCTGLGVTAPSAETGLILPLDAVNPAVLQPTVTIGGRPAAMTGAFTVPGFLGLYGAIVTVPTGLTSGNQPVVVSAGGMMSNTVQIAVR
ncbi:hypothetical protein F183_A38100 [Bryobacterales bacterium F-183]|nr:hypothetical protein F183_A38100 [Bryobacterales bacterium F-183]